MIHTANPKTIVWSKTKEIILLATKTPSFSCCK